MTDTIIPSESRGIRVSNPGIATRSFDFAQDDKLRKAKKFAGAFGEDLRFFLLGKIFHRFDESARVRFAEREWVIGAERDAICAEKFQEQPERVGIVHERVDIKVRGFISAREIGARIFFIVGCDQIGSNVKSVLNPADSSGKCAATVGESDAQLGETLEHSAKNH